MLEIYWFVGLLMASLAFGWLSLQEGEAVYNAIFIVLSFFSFLGAWIISWDKIGDKFLTNLVSALPQTGELINAFTAGFILLFLYGVIGALWCFVLPECLDNLIEYFKNKRSTSRGVQRG